MRLYLVHHGDALPPGADPRQPLSPVGREQVDRTAREAAARGARPQVVWHSGKLRARETALAFWRACNALADFAASRDLQPADPPVWMRDRLRAETRDVLIVGHFPHLPRLLAALLDLSEGAVDFPPHGVVAMETDDEGASWREVWRLAP